MCGVNEHVTLQNKAKKREKGDVTRKKNVLVASQKKTQRVQKKKRAAIRYDDEGMKVGYLMIFIIIWNFGLVRTQEWENDDVTKVPSNKFDA